MSKASKTQILSPRPAAKSRQHSQKEDTAEKRASAPGQLSKIAPAPLPLGRMEHMRPAHHVSLTEMSPQDLGGMLSGLDQARAQYEALSGACGTLAGLVCMEAKKRLKHGEYLPWLKTHLGKSRQMASQYASVANAFLKCQPKLTFEQMTLALMDGAQSVSALSLDRTHPVVDAVCKWAKGRTFYQLSNDEAVDGRHGNKGGNQHPKCPHCSGNLKTKKQQICPHCKKDTGAPVEEGDPKEAEAIDLWTPLLRDLRMEAITHKSFVHLPDKGPVSREALKGLVIDLAKSLRAAKRKTK